MSGYQSLNALNCSARKCKAEMEAVSGLEERRKIIDRYMVNLKLIGFSKSDLQYEIYKMRKEFQ